MFRKLQTEKKSSSSNIYNVDMFTYKHNIHFIVLSTTVCKMYLTINNQLFAETDTVLIMAVISGTETLDAPLDHPR